MLLIFFPLKLVIWAKREEEENGMWPLQRDGNSDGQTQRTFSVTQRTRVWSLQDPAPGNKWQSCLLKPQHMVVWRDPEPAHWEVLKERVKVAQAGIWWGHWHLGFPGSSYKLSLRCSPSPQSLYTVSILGVCTKDYRVSLVDEIYSYNNMLEHLEGMPCLEEQCLVNLQKYSRGALSLKKEVPLGVDGSPLVMHKESGPHTIALTFFLIISHILVISRKLINLWRARIMSGYTCYTFSSKMLSSEHTVGSG